MTLQTWETGNQEGCPSQTSSVQVYQLLMLLSCYNIFLLRQLKSDAFDTSHYVCVETKFLVLLVTLRDTSKSDTPF